MTSALKYRYSLPMETFHVALRLSLPALWLPCLRGDAPLRFSMMKFGMEQYCHFQNEHKCMEKKIDAPPLLCCEHENNPVTLDLASLTYMKENCK